TKLIYIVAAAPARPGIPKRPRDRVLQGVLGCALQGTGDPLFDILGLTRLIALPHFPVEKLTRTHFAAIRRIAPGVFESSSPHQVSSPERELPGRLCPDSCQLTVGSTKRGDDDFGGSRSDTQIS